MTLTKLVLITVSVFLLATCRPPETVEEPFEPAESWEQYRKAISLLDLADTLMGASWISAGERALTEPAGVETPLEEIFYFDPHRPEAVSYRFPLRRGRRLTVEIETDSEAYFADIFRLPDSTENVQDAPVLVASRPAGGNRIELEARQDKFYLLRIQPELLRGGRFRVRILSSASLTFPVEGAGPGSILSFYGDHRDGGYRVHEGVDIFAPRGTPLLATSDAVVFRVGERERGGKIVSLRDEKRDLMIYYAHLDEQLVTAGGRVSAGDVIGTVGNTGNAINTPPHLHIGIYQGGWRGAVDPWEYLVDPAVTSPPPVHGEELIGRWFRLGADMPVERSVPAVSATPRYVNRNPFFFVPGTVPLSERGLREQSTPPPPSFDFPRDTAVQVAGAVSASDRRVRVRAIDGSTWVVRYADLREAPVPGGARGTLAEETTQGVVPLRDPLSGDIVAEVDLFSGSVDGSVEVIGHAGALPGVPGTIVVAFDPGPRTGADVRVVSNVVHSPVNSP